MDGIKGLCKRFLLLAGMAAVIFMVFIFTRPSAVIALTHSNEAITSNTTWHKTDNPHIIEGYVAVAGEINTTDMVTLTIEPGCELRFDAGAYLYIGPPPDITFKRVALEAQGTNEDPIIFTSNTTNPLPGDWFGIIFDQDTNDAGTILDHCKIEYASVGIYCYQNASPSIYCTVIRNNDYGVGSGYGSQPVINNCSIIENTNGVVNLDSNVTLNAENNWWGDASGPADYGDGCASGSGNSVSCYVDYAPFLTSPHTCFATAVELVFFKAGAGNDGVTLNWETATEVDNAGFNIYRSRLRDGEYKKINDTLVPAQGDATSGASYHYEDTPPASGTYYYKLEDVDTNGVSTMHGPENVRVRSTDREARRSKGQKNK